MQGDLMPEKVMSEKVMSNSGMSARMQPDGDRDRRMRIVRRVAWWLGVAPSLCCAVLGVLLVRLPGLYDLPQRDRPYGWLTDRLAVGGGWMLLVLAALFALLAVALFIRARRIQASADATAGHATGG